MRTPLIAAVLLIAAAPALAQPHPHVGARTTSPEAMVAQMNPASPEEEMSQAIAAADQHPLGTLENPVRVAGPDGERAYLARLRCADGTAAQIGERREAGVDPYGSIAGVYGVICGRADLRIVFRIVFDMYQEEHQESRAPANFTLAP